MSEVRKMIEALIEGAISPAPEAPRAVEPESDDEMREFIGNTSLPNRKASKFFLECDLDALRSDPETNELICGEQEMDQFAIHVLRSIADELEKGGISGGLMKYGGPDGVLLCNWGFQHGK